MEKFYCLREEVLGGGELPNVLRTQLSVTNPWGICGFIPPAHRLYPPVPKACFMTVSVFFPQQVKAGVGEARVLGSHAPPEEDEMGPGHPQASLGLCPSSPSQTCSLQTY